MSPLTGITDNLPSDLIIEAGVIMVGTTIKGTTIGGVKLDPGKTFRQIEYDGKKADIQEGDRIVMWKPKLSFTLQELGHSSTGNQISLVEQGSTSADSGHQSTLKGLIRTITPKTAGVLFSTGDYATDLYAILELGGGSIYRYARIHFPIAFCSKYDIATQSAQEGKINCEFEARLSRAQALATPGLCPYTIEYSQNLPS